MARAFHPGSKWRFDRGYIVATELLLAMGLCACTAARHGTASQPPDLEPIRYSRGLSDLTTPRSFVWSPAPDRFSVCYGNTCRNMATVDLHGAPWDRIRAVFSPEAQSAEQERGQIAEAIARIESAVGEVTGTWRDRGENSAGRGEDGQMDCVDEANNSTVYLDMLQNDGLLRWHRVGPRVSRGISRLLAPHFTATIVENESGARFAVDSWFRDNGEPPYIVSLAEWQHGWRPGAAAGHTPQDNLAGSNQEALPNE